MTNSGINRQSPHSALMGRFETRLLGVMMGTSGIEK
jgi:hypothetical protein